MARKRTIYVSALNITLHEHSAERYIELFKFIRSKKLRAKYHGDRRAGIVSLGKRESKDSQFLIGQICSFVELDPTDQWFNDRTGQPAEDEDLEKLEVPEYLKPGMRLFYFAFFPQRHRLFFESRSHGGQSLGPNNARRIFENFLSDQAVIEKFGAGNVTIEPQTEALSHIFRISRLDYLSMFVTRPNPDDTEDAAARVKKRMKTQNAQQFEEHLKAEKGESLKPDKETVELAEVASSNGYVYGRGRDEAGDPIEESTKSHPLRRREQYDPAVETPDSVIVSAAMSFFRGTK